MSYATAKLFAWLQRADFYQALHLQAVEQLPMGNGTLWLDIGCGPGLVARLAASRGYRAMGADSDPHMIRAARRIAARNVSLASFTVDPLDELVEKNLQADVVSAASFLAVLKDKVNGLGSLAKCVRPGGKLLVIEPTRHMHLQAANELIKKGVATKGANALRLWAYARQGRAVDVNIVESLGARHVKFMPLLNGLVCAWLIQL